MSSTEVKSVLVVNFPHHRPRLFLDSLASVRDYFEEASIDVVVPPQFEDLLIEEQPEVGRVVKEGSRDLFKGGDSAAVRRFVNDQDYDALVLPTRDLEAIVNEKIEHYLLLYPWLDGSVWLVDYSGNWREVGWGLYRKALGQKIYREVVKFSGELLLALVLLPVNFFFFLVYSLLEVFVHRSHGE